MPLHRLLRARWRVAALCLSGLMSVAGPAQAQPQAFPSKPITLVVPYAPGGAGDILGRALAKELTTQLGQSVVVDNRAGAGGNIGADAVVRAPDKDGHTLLLAATSLASNPSIMRKMPFNPTRDLLPVGGVASLQNVVAVKLDAPIHSIAELIQYAKAHPGKLSFGTAGVGTSSHLSVELFKAEVGVDILHVPYKSGAPALADMMAGNLDMAFELMPAIVNHLRNGKLRGLAVTGAKRSPALPELPTVAEAGVPNYSFISWFGVFAPAGMAPERLQQLNAIVNKAIGTAEFKGRLDAMGAEAMPGSQAQFATFFQGEVARWAKVAQSQKLSPID